MALSWLFLVFSSVLFSSVFGAEEKPDIYDQAAVCSHRFHMGCMLDVVEKSCTGLQAVEACATKGKCNMDELNRIVGALDPSNFEALGKCCCTKAFKEGGYEDCKNPDPVCKKAIADHVEKDLKNHLAAMKKCLKKPKKATCKEALDSVKWVGTVRLQHLIFSFVFTPFVYLRHAHPLQVKFTQPMCDKVKGHRCSQLWCYPYNLFDPGPLHINNIQ